MANTLVTKNSSSAANVPTAGEMVTGELAINTADQILYSKDASAVFRVGVYDDVAETISAAWTFTAQLTIDDGTAAAPGLISNADANTGFYWGGSAIGVSADGVQTAQFDGAKFKSWQDIICNQGISSDGTVTDVGQAGVFAFIDQVSTYGRLGSYNYDAGPAAWAPLQLQASDFTFAIDATTVVQITSTAVTKLNRATGGEMLLLTDTGGAGVVANPFIGFDDSGGVRQGYMGFGSVSNADMYLKTDIGGIRLDAADFILLGTGAVYPNIDMNFTLLDMIPGATTEGFRIGSSGDVTFIRPRNTAGDGWDTAKDLNYDRSLGRWYFDNTLAVNGGFIYALSGTDIRAYNNASSLFGAFFHDETDLIIDTNSGGGDIKLTPDNGNVYVVGALQMADNLVTRPYINDYAITRSTVTATASTTLNYSTAQVWAITMNANITTFAISNPPITTRYGEMTLKLIYNSGTARTIDWSDESVKWGEPGEPTLTSVSGKHDVIHLWTDDAGATWYGSYILNY